MDGLVVKDNILINSTYYLELVEQRIILLAIVVMRESGGVVEANKLIKFSVSDYVKLYGVDNSTAYETLKNSAQSLRTRYVSYKDKNPQTGHDRSFDCNWVSQIGYEEGSATIYISFNEVVMPLITRLDKNFTTYQLAKISNLKSKYAIRLYEILMSWKGVKKTPCIQLEDLRSILGVLPNEYKIINNFKVRVLDLAVNQINEHTDIIVSYEQHKRGRAVSGITFSFKFKKEAIEGESREVKPLTAKQVFMFSNKLSENKAFHSIFEPNVGEDYEDYAERIAQRLLDPKYIEEWHSYLVEVGYNA